MNTTQIQARIDSFITQQKEELATAQAKINPEFDYLQDIIDNVIDVVEVARKFLLEESEESNQYFARLQVKRNKAALERTEHMTADSLVHCPKRYVAIAQSDDLISPSGFNSIDRVFIKPQSGFIVHADRIQDIPKNLKYFEINA